MSTFLLFKDTTQGSVIELPWQGGGLAILTETFLEDFHGGAMRNLYIVAIVSTESSSREKDIAIEATKSIDGQLMYVLQETLSRIYCVKSRVENTYLGVPSGMLASSSKGDHQNEDFIEIDHSSSSSGGSLKMKEKVNDVIIDLSGSQEYYVNEFDKGKEPESLFKFSTVKNILEGCNSQMLGNLIKESDTIVQVNELPETYDGNITFELPAEMDIQKSWNGMQQKYDGHIWSKPITTNVAYRGKVRKSICGGHFECPNYACNGRDEEGAQNMVNFDGHLKIPCPLHTECSGKYGSLKCFYCRFHVVCIQMCKCIVYYVIPEDLMFTRIVIHSGMHEHPVRQGLSKRRLIEIKEKVKEVLKYNDGAAPRKIQMELAKDLISTCVNSSSDGHVGMMSESDIWRVAKEMQPLVLQGGGFNRIVKSARREMGTPNDSLDSLLILKRTCRYDFFHGCLFPGQGGRFDRCFVFKMSTRGPASGVDIVNRMNREGNADLRRAWVMFDHTHRVKGWSTMGAHVYDPRYFF